MTMLFFRNLGTRIAQLLAWPVVAFAVGLVIDSMSSDPVQFPFAARMPTASTAPAANAETYMNRTISLVDLHTYLAEHAILVDVRAPAFFKAGHIPGALNLPLEELAAGGDTITAQIAHLQDARVIVYCGGTYCDDALNAAMILADAGCTDVSVFTGGWKEWEANQSPSSRSK